MIKQLIFLTAFYIYHEGNIKNFPNIINNCPKGTCYHDPLAFSFYLLRTTF